MKLLTLAVLLASFVSCGGSGGGNNGIPVKERYQNAFSTLVRGQSAKSIGQGQIRSYDFNTQAVTTHLWIQKNSVLFSKLQAAISIPTK